MGFQSVATSPAHLSSVQSQARTVCYVCLLLKLLYAIGSGIVKLNTLDYTMLKFDIDVVTHWTRTDF